MTKRNSFKRTHFCPGDRYRCLGFIAMSLVMTVGSVVALAEPELMQPVEDIRFQELPPPWESQANQVIAQSNPMPQSSASSVVRAAPASPQPQPKPVSVAPVQRPQPRQAPPQVHKPAPVRLVPSRVEQQSEPVSPAAPATYVNPVVALERVAQQGNINAQYDLAMRYQYGNGVEKSRSRAHEWLEKAATAGYPKAQYALSLFYQQYAPNTQGIKKSLLWMKRAADSGYADAQYSLGMMFMNGTHVYLDTQEGRQWLQKAAAQGHEAARLALR